MRVCRVVAAVIFAVAVTGASAESNVEVSSGGSSIVWVINDTSETIHVTFKVGIRAVGGATIGPNEAIEATHDFLAGTTIGVIHGPRFGDKMEEDEVRVPPPPTDPPPTPEPGFPRLPDGRVSKVICLQLNVPLP